MGGVLLQFTFQEPRWESERVKQSPNIPSSTREKPVQTYNRSSSLGPWVRVYAASCVGWYVFTSTPCISVQGGIAIMHLPLGPLHKTRCRYIYCHSQGNFSVYHLNYYHPTYLSPILTLSTLITPTQYPAYLPP